MHSDTDLISFADRLADAAADVVLRHFRDAMDVDNKLSEGFDPVTIADRGAEQVMRALIESTYPDHGIVGEEFGSVRADAEHVWVLDPIDGTRSFITGVPLWGTLIGLTRNGSPLAGMMAQPYIGERFAGDGKRAWYSGPKGKRDLKTRACSALSDAVVFTTTPALFSPVERVCYDRIEEQARLARYGTDCYGYCMVAAGQADLVIEAGLQSYDIVALAPIIEGAGGAVTTWTGGSIMDGGRIIASGDKRLHDIVLRDLSRCPAG
ncbi:histidinol-phosphatase [Breoghania sp. L-A4]|uniref:histidinol-phosphatase n=1 Tax=Breoghania sp. L-A4 TaxID=2304600 RepID=UPI000E35B18E|nr:histidinol-phosphatase [Breoghania sp. L-A4]AXS41862.1 histidinol-phosphatase [Breoghania sp. L-A4]